MYYSSHTNQWLQPGFCQLDKSLINPNGKVNQNLTVFRQVKVSQAVFILFWRIAFLKHLQTRNKLLSILFKN